MERTEERMGFCGGGCDGFVGHVSPGCQGAPVWWYGGGGRIRSAAAAAEEEAEDGAKTGLESNPSLLLPPSLPSFSHTDSKLPQIPFTRSPAEWSQSPERQLT